MRFALIVLFCLTILVAIFAVARIYSLIQRRKNAQDHFRSRNIPKPTQDLLTYCLCITTVILLVLSIFCLMRYNDMTAAPTEHSSTAGSTSGSTVGSSDATSQTTTAPTTSPTTQPTTVTTDPPGPPADPELNAAYTDKTNPENWAVNWEIIVNEAITGSYNREETISFANPEKYPYFSLAGVATFRGNNYRNGATYGTAVVENEALNTIWSSNIGSLARPSGGSWTGSGWTGQPLIVQWDEATKQVMNLYEDKKAKEDLVEVIYATLDGKIYFYDLEDGSYTRDPINVGMAFKGAGALDPRGYPILYVGSGDKTVNGKNPRMYIISLIDGSIMYERGHAEFYALRSWTAYDSSPLVHVQTDTLIWPAENGMLFTMKLNTAYDPVAGTISIAPDAPVMTRYSNNLGTTLGYEASSIIVDNYLYIGDNGGMFFCVDLNTMGLVWAQNISDDLNATPVFEWGDDGKGYLYLGTSMEYNNGTSYIMKLDASTGEEVWKIAVTDVVYDKNVSGGVLSSPLLGKAGTKLEGMIIFSVAKTPGAYNGILMALDTETGEEVWTKTLSSYTWSSPVAFYEDDGNAYVTICDSAGNVFLLDGASGEQLSKVNIGSNVEASPAVFNDTLVVGTRGQKVYAVQIS